ncbi:TPR and ankyrin repeat-containing protein 1 [Tachyglossus aculeatus]|uniref:TPR and ankyrin repeat-containing protein 1 n=1 Tax=Tachyglossus aculeatus TaxID=9261 RepID=UPI0018F76944|nr:TPR and ankyrin repeat-containing protein 1 [Tachyglossus aculeatus]
MDPVTYAEFLRESGNEAFRTGNYTLAIRKYDEAISVLLQLYHWGVPPRDLAVLLCNKSNAYYNLEKWGEACSAAQESLRWDPTYVKGYYRAGYSLLQLFKPHEASQMFSEGLGMLQSSLEVGQTADFLVGLLASINEHQVELVGFSAFSEEIFSPRFTALIWQQVIEKLTRKGMWQALLLLSTEKERLPGLLSIPQLSLRELFEKYVFCGDYVKLEMVPSLVEWLISLGASVESIGLHPLHAIMRLCILAKESRLFRWLLDQRPDLVKKINTQDEEGRTLLHLVAANSPGYLIKRQTEDVQMLLRFGVDPRTPDRQSRRAADILKRNKNFKAVEKINSHLERLSSFPQEFPGQGNGEITENENDVFLAAFEELAKFFGSERRVQDKNLLKQEAVQKFIHALATVQEIPPTLACEVDPPAASALIKLLLERQKWSEVLLLLTRKANGGGEPAPGLIQTCDLSDVDICVVIQHLSSWDDRRTHLLRCLIDRGASPDGLRPGRERPLPMCLKDNDFQLAYLLLSKGADPRSISLAEGDTPLHASLYIILDKKDEIGFSFLNHLLGLFSSDPSAFPYLNPNAQDVNGNTMMHIIFQRKPTKRLRRLMDLLARFDINLNLKNKWGKDVKYRVKKSDPLLVSWTRAVLENRRRNKQEPAGPVNKTVRSPAPSPSPQSKSPGSSPSASASASPDGRETAGDARRARREMAGDARGAGREAGAAGKAYTLRDGLVQAITALIAQVEQGGPEAPEDPPAPPPPSAAAPAGGRAVDIRGPEERASREAAADGNGPAPVANGPVGAGALAGEVRESEAHLQDFDKMTWEIECTSDVLKKLGSPTVPRPMRRKIVLAIQQLGNGEWTQSLQKRLRHLTAGIRLYEAKLDKGARMLWELAIDFSPRCSENPEKLAAPHRPERSGRVYTEMIRIWDIVLDHCKLNDAIKAICSAYNRGLACILRKKLKGINQGQLSSHLKIQRRIPRCYVEDVEAGRGRGPGLLEYFPPASAVETEYSIMKFHSFSTDMAFNIVHDSASPVEYPFRVGELEYAVIGLNPRPLEPIVLIGRSGTGKTTCCLYRLWRKFHSYWEKAHRARSPLLVRQTWQWRQLRAEEEEEEAGEEEEEEEDGRAEDGGRAEAREDEEGAAAGPGAESGLDGGEEAEGGGPAAEEGGVREPDRLEHLHQVFVTKNHVLCREVQRNFVELSRCTQCTSHFKPLEPNVHRLQDVKDENFPLCLTSKQLLLLLDASLPDPFFLRNEDGSLKRNIVGWSAQEEQVIPNWQEEDEDWEADGGHQEEDGGVDASAGEDDPRVFVTYEVFAQEMWPKMVRGKHPFNPALVWKEIKSFLKGSFEALNCPRGRLTEEEYKKLGKKRSPNFKEDRGEVYNLFLLYQQIRSQKGYFDEEDVLYNLSCRLARLPELPWSIHELYGDEIQDFTQAELALLMRCINDPNAMFLTGDTAQSIMKGVAFRFSDLRSLFHYASKNCVDKKQCAVRKPKRIYQLYQNYRSHSGILNLASGVVDLLQYYFPESFDRLPRDSGLFDGPKPTVLESCSVSDLAILLRGNKRKTQPIEFGAHQVILVANEMAKEKIPEELGLALVLTIYEAKGLEFDDVLLYNFFTDSEAYKEWKIISSFTPSPHMREKNKPIIEVALEKRVASPSRSLGLNVEMYKLLNGELKQLYTAITRARVNLWIFDENRDKRDPAFKYFIKREFVQVVKTDENKDFDDSMFVKTSTPREWIAQGEYYAKHQCWKVAAKCYQKGGALEKEKLALAHNAVLNVKSKKISPKGKQMEYLELAKTYLECGEPKLSLKCLSYAKEFQLSAQLCEKLGKMKDAAYFYKRSQCFKDASRCFEQVQEFDLALKMYCQAEMFEEAAVAVEKYEKILRAKNPAAPKLSYSASQFYLEAAAKYLSANRIPEMMGALSNLEQEDQLVFLKSRKRLTEAADLLKRDGREEEAALLMKQHGFLLEAARLTPRPDFRASCLLGAARRLVAGSGDAEETEAILREALELSEQTGQRAGVAEAVFLQGVLRRDFPLLRDAFYQFLRLNHYAGGVEALYHATALGEAAGARLLALGPGGLEALLNLARALRRASNNAEKDMVKSCFDFFGLSPEDPRHGRVSPTEPGPFLGVLPDADAGPRGRETGDGRVPALHKHLLGRLCAIGRGLLRQRAPEACAKYLVGLSCPDARCPDLHRPLQRHEARAVLHAKMHLVAVGGLLLEAKRVFPQAPAKELAELDALLAREADEACRSLLDAVFPKPFHPRVLSETPAACVELLGRGPRSLKPCRVALKEHVRGRFRRERPRSRRESTDLWLAAMRASALSSGYPEELERLLHQEEEDYNRELKALGAREERARGRGGREEAGGRPAKGPEGRFGMLAPDWYDGSAERAHLSFVRLLENSLEQLYGQRNPEGFKRLFFRFLNVLVRRCTEPLMPSIGNTVALLEFQFVHCAAVLARLWPGAVLCLPESYVALVHHWGHLFGGPDREAGGAFSVLQDYKPKDPGRAARAFRFHLSYLAGVLCGAENPGFDVMLDAFGEPGRVASGEAERATVLCLAMLVNADEVLQPRCKPILFRHFPEMEAKLRLLRYAQPDLVPARLVRLVDRVLAAPDVGAVAEALQDLLLERDGEYLVDCRWRGDGPASGRGLRYEAVSLARLGRLDPVQGPAGPEADYERDEPGEEREDPLAAILSQKRLRELRKASTRRRLRRVCLVVSLCVRWRRGARPPPEPGADEARPPGTPGPFFKQADVDRTQCDLCGVRFSRGPEDLLGPAGAFEGEAGAGRPGRAEAWPAGRLSYEDHVRLEEHRGKLLAYQRYLGLLAGRVEPAVEEGVRLVRDIEQSLWVRGHLGSKEQSNMMQRKVQENIKRISDAAEDLYRRKAWADAEDIMVRPVHVLMASVERAREWLKKTETWLKEEGFAQENELENEEDFGELCTKKRWRKRGKPRRY